MFFEAFNVYFIVYRFDLAFSADDTYRVQIVSVRFDCIFGASKVAYSSDTKMGASHLQGGKVHQ